MRSMKILLDIDDTSLIYNKETKQYEEHPQLRRLFKNHTIILYSGNPDIKMYAEKWKTNGYILKAEDKIPEADILIDNDFELWSELVNVKRYYKSIDEFFENE